MEINFNTTFFVIWFAIGMWLIVQGTHNALRVKEALKDGYNIKEANEYGRKGALKSLLIGGPVVVILWGGSGVFVLAIWQMF
tara:strand:- start:709 stop:954 length:246 start_codon:yes stop_codon:yes gene_type:complete